MTMTALLKYLEQESIEIIRRLYPEADNPVVLYSVGKDSSVLLHFLKKHFIQLKFQLIFYI